MAVLPDRDSPRLFAAATHRISAKGPCWGQQNSLSLLPLRGANEPSCRNSARQYLHELPQPARKTDYRDREAQGGRAIAAADPLGEGSQPPRLRVLQSQPACAVGRIVPAMSGAGGRDGASRAG